MIASNWKPVVKATLRGYCSIQDDSGLILNGCALHERDGERWVCPPSKSYTKKDGTTVYEKIVEFKDSAAKKRFKEQAIPAIDLMLAELARVAA
jgi:hypothetical protein